MPATQNSKILYLSKSQFIKGVQCHKSLYLHKYQPELRDEISESQEAVFQSGKDVGIMARNLFPGGIEITYDNNPLANQIRQTHAEITNGTTIIYEAAFSYRGLFCKVDILRKGDQGWEIYEVKASTKMEEIYYHDVAFQYYVMTAAGLPVSKVFLVHINNQYVRNGAIDVYELFTVKDVTKDIIAKQQFVADEIRNQQDMLSGKMPDIDIGPYCDNPYGCDFKGHCWSHIPENSVFSLRGKGVNKFDLYNQGIIHMEEIPPDILNVKQHMQLEYTLQKRHHIDTDKIRHFLESLWYPLCYLDFETFMMAIPPFDGLRPYQQVPFQYSLHYQEYERGELLHREFLAFPNTDPREIIAKRLTEEIPDNACVIVYNRSFESGRLRDLADWFPRYKEKIETIIDNMMDLMIPFRNRDCYFWEMCGSYSIKYVLPALLPELSYSNMEISEGDMAMVAYDKMNQSLDPKEVDGIRKALLEYCKLDTMGMVRIVDRLREMITL